MKSIIGNRRARASSPGIKLEDTDWNEVVQGEESYSAQKSRALCRISRVCRGEPRLDLDARRGCRTANSLIGFGRAS